MTVLEYRKKHKKCRFCQHRSRLDWCRALGKFVHFRAKWCVLYEPSKYELNRGEAE